MLHELRVYTFAPGGATVAAKAAGTIGLDIRGNNFGKLEGYWVSEVGPLNQALHLWSFEGYDQRKKLRADLAKNERWVKEYVPVIQNEAKLLRQDISFLNPVVGPKAPAGTGNLYELRTYRLKPGAIGQWLANFKEALPVRERHSKIVALWSGEAGQPNEVKHLWAYPSFEARMKTRDAVAADKDWQAVVARNRPLLEAQETQLLLPSSHSPLR